MGIHRCHSSLDGSAGDRRWCSLLWGEQTVPANGGQAKSIFAHGIPKSMRKLEDQFRSLGILEFLPILGFSIQFPLSCTAPPNSQKKDAN